MLGKNNIGSGSNAIELDDATLNIYAPRGSNIEVKTKGKIWRGVAGNISKLPEEYQEVKYLESTGTQYIDTGVILTASIGFEIKGLYSVTTHDYQCLFGATSDNHPTRILAGPNGGNIEYSYGNNNLTFPFQDYKAHIYSYNNNIMTADDYSKTVSNPALASKNLYIFRDNYTYSYYAKAKVYYLKIWDNNTLIRNMVPCYRISDHKPGMYNTIDSIFYTNSGSDEFILGPEASGMRVFAIKRGEYYVKGTHWDGMDTKLVGIYENGEYEAKLNLNEHNVPSIYQEVEYLQNSGTQYINSGINAINGYKAETKFAFINPGTVFGSGNQWNTGFRIWYRDATYGLVGNYGELTISPYNMVNFPNATKNTIYECTLKSGEMFLNGEQKTFTPNSTGFGTEITIFAHNIVSELIAGGELKLYKLIFTNSDNVILENLIPVRRKSDSKPGMYDLVSGSFLMNAGTGEFIVGDDV